MTTDDTEKRPDQRLVVLLFCSLVGIYLLVYSSQPTSLDDQAVIAEAAALAQHGRPDINAIAYTEWLLPIRFSGMGRLGADGALYSKKEPFRALALLPLAVAARALPWLPARATAMLFNTLVTAAGALALYELTRRLKYRARTAVTLALLYGLTTFALVYAKTLFGEPLAALLLLVGLMAAYRYRQQPERHPALLAGALLGLAIGINNIYALLAPLVSFYMFGRSPRRLSHALSYLIPIAVCLGLLGLYNWARYGTPLQGGYEFAEGEGFTHAVLTGLYGLFLSPFRGLFWYNPVLLLALPGWLMLRRRHARLAWLALALVAIQAVTFAAWWSWHGGIVWGPRFLLPITPLFVLCLAPLVEAMWRQRALLVIVCAFAAVSASIQALGALFDASTYTNTYLNTHYWTGDAGAPVPMLADDVLYNPGLSPIVGHLALLYAGWPLHPAWLAQGVDWGHLLVSVALIGLGIWLAYRLPKRRWLIAGVAVFIACNGIAARQQQETDEVDALEAALQPPGMVVAATTLFGDALVELDNGSRVMTLNAPTTPDDPLAAALWDYALGQQPRLWYVTWFGPADPANWQERQLWETASFAREQWVAGHRALLFDLAPSPLPNQAGGWRFGGVRLNAYGYDRAADGLRLALVWSAGETMEADYSWFVHLLDASGQIVAQQDRQPLGGYAPTSTWTPGTTGTDRLYFPIMTEVVQVRIGWVDPTNGERLPVFGANGERLTEDFVLLDVEGA